MERVGFVVLAWFIIGCLVALVLGQIIRRGSATEDRHSDSRLERPTEKVKRGEHPNVERTSQCQALRHRNEE